MSTQKLALEDCPQALIEVEILAQEGLFQEAITLCFTVHRLYAGAKRTKDSASAASRLAELYEQIGQLDSAVPFHKAAYNLDPSNSTILANYGNFLYQRNEVSEASKIFSALLLILPGSNPPITKPEIYLRLGELCLMETPPNKAKALDIFKRGLEFDPENAALKDVIERAKRGEAPTVVLFRAPEPELKREPQSQAPLQHFSSESGMKQSRTCPKCKHNRILYIDQVADQTGDQKGHSLEHGTEAAPQVQPALPWRIARTENPNKSFWTLDIVTAGLVEAYVCRGCGFTELYTKDPSKIPVDGKYVQELVGPEGNDPFR